MILELLIQDGFLPQRKGAAEHSSPCPECGGDDRFIVWSDSDRYWCRQCGAAGDAIQYLRDFHGMSFQDAAEAVGKPLPERTAIPKTDARADFKKYQPDIWRKRINGISCRAHEQLIADPSKLEWLETERSIKAETAKRFGLGWIYQDHYFRRHDFGLENTGKKLFIPSGLTIPYPDIRLRIRRDNPGKQDRYRTVAGSTNDPFLIGNFHETTAVILESELDAILLSQESQRNLFIVALGSAQKKPDEALLVMLSFCPVVLVALDNDEAGAKAARWWLENLQNSFRTLSPKKIGKDLTDAFINGLDLNEWLSISLELYCDSIREEKHAS